jgi:glutamate-1-semialdehyde 2,1-aminomutase
MIVEELVPAWLDDIAPGELRARAADLFPGGVNSPVRAYRAVGGEPPEILAGEGPLVRDVDGRTYVDLVGAYGPLILGHADRRVATAIATAALDGGPFGVTNAAEVRLGEGIRAAIPSIERLRFTTSGTEAVMSALRVARAATGRDLVLKFDGGYHGHSDGLLAEAGSGLATLGLPGSAGVTRAVAAETLVAPYNDLAAVRAIVAEHRERIAAIVVEPVAANMGVVAPARGFLEGLRALTAREGIVLVFDEVITGFRVAHGGAQARYGVRPDLTVLGKIIGGGLPIGAYGGRAELMDLVAPAGPVYQAGTLAGHPIAMAAGAATLEALDDDLYAELERLGGSLAAALAAAADEAGVPVAIGRVGSLLTVFFRAELPVDHRSARDSDTAAFARFHRASRLAGIHAPPSQFEAWFLSAAHTDGELARIVEAARIGFAAAAAP